MITVLSYIPSEPVLYIIMPLYWYNGLHVSPEIVLPVLAVLVLPRGKVHVLNEWLCDHQGMSLKHGEAFLQDAFTE